MKRKKTVWTVLYFIFNKNKAHFFTSAINAPVIVRNKEMLYLDCDRMPVGKSEHMNDFSFFSSELKIGDWLYALSDGFSEQFGRKTKKRLKKEGILCS